LNGGNLFGCLLGAASNLLADGPTFTAIDYPAAASTFAWGMNSHGDILGSYTFADNVNHNFVMSANQFSAIGQFTTMDDVAGALATVVIAIHGGDIVGGYMSADKVGHGFLLVGFRLSCVSSGS
jgi:hypothetical protein